jgi:hypothetical protein
MKPWRFYVYELRGDCGTVKYVGKGSGNRLAVSARARGLSGQEVARFSSEKEAYAFEVARIAELTPSLNICKGGNGSRVRKVRATRKNPWGKWGEVFDALGSRVYAARLLVAYSEAGLVLPRIEEIRRVAYGTTA